MPDGYHVAFSVKDVRLAELDVHVGEPCRSQNHENGVTINVELRSLMSAERVLDGEFV
jgi:hypothetical protein